MMVRRNSFNGRAKIAKEMKVAVTRANPVPELDAELEGRLGLAQEVGFIDSQQAVHRLDDRHRGFTDANRADFLRLNQHDVDASAREESREDGGGHPASRTPANNGGPTNQ